MPETDYNIATKKGQTRKAKIKSETKAKIKSKAKAQMARWENIPKNVSWLCSCGICGRTRIESRMAFYVDDEVFVCKEGCASRAWAELPHDKRWDE